MSFSAAQATMRPSSGGFGDDDVFGEDGNDNLHGGPGDDKIYGGPGDDVIGDLNGPTFGNPADADVVFDGPGVDYVDLSDGDGNDVLCTTDGETLDGSDPCDQVIDDPELCELL